MSFFPEVFVLQARKEAGRSMTKKCFQWILEKIREEKLVIDSSQLLRTLERIKSHSLRLKMKVKTI